MGHWPGGRAVRYTDRMPLSSPSLFAPASGQQPPQVLIVAELGVNHDGNVARALELVSTAAAAGADAVKLQLFHPHNLLSNQALVAQYQANNGVDDPYQLLDRLKLTVPEMHTVRARARELNLRFIVTPFSLEDVPGVGELDVDAVKIASPDAVNPPLLNAAAKLGKPMLVSTGTCETPELGFAAELLRQHPAGGALMQCVSSYPTPPEMAAVGAIADLRQRFGLPVGYSDHTSELITGAVAVAAGACVIEKHLTYDTTAAGPDHAASLDAVHFSHYVELTRQAAAMLGPLQKRVLDCERDVRLVARQSVCAKNDLHAGHVLLRENLTVKRPAPPGAVPAAELEAMVGRKLGHPVRGGDLLMRGDL